ncbi:MAG: DnaD domain protein [Oscillospiraceae bacterium]
MNEKILALKAADADKLLACADGDCALLYLHILRTGAFSLTAACRDLKRPESQIALAADTLRRLGLLEKPEAPLRSEELPEYTAGDIVSRVRSDAAFEGVVREAERALGKVLSSSDLKILFGIYDHLGLPAEVIYLLLNHVIESYQAQNGQGRMPTMRAVEKEAWFWSDREILTLDAAEEHIRREKEKKELVTQVKELLQIRGRALTAGEKKYIDSWLDMGFSPDALAIAYDRTVLGTGKLAWKYMDKIVRSWNEKKLYTPEAIEAGDARYTPRKSTLTDQEADDRDLEYTRRMYEHMMNKGKGNGHGS